MVKTRSEVVRYLQTNGPSAGAELPREASSPSITAYERKEGVRTFNPSLSNPTRGTGIGKTKPVYFLHKEHAPEPVIREWVSLNPAVIGGVAPRAFLKAVNDVGPMFSEVSKEVARDLYGEAVWEDTFGGSGGGNPEGTNSHALRDRLLDADADEVFGSDE